MYPEQLVIPMREDLTTVGFQEFKTAEEVDTHLQSHQGTTLVVINSVCGCAAGAARPGVKLSLQGSEKQPDQLTTVFAGVDHEAVNKIREYTLPYPPSSPAIALLRRFSVSVGMGPGSSYQTFAARMDSLFTLFGDISEPKATVMCAECMVEML